MSQDHVSAQLKAIFEDPKWPFPLNHAMAAAWLAANFKGENLKIYDMTDASAMCDFNIVATAQNPTQARAMVDLLGRAFREQGVKIVSHEGYESADWILLDTGDVIFHVFQESARDIYSLDHVFRARKQVAIPEDFYFGAQRPSLAEDQALKGFF
jgi:ribosome-associated protein